MARKPQVEDNAMNDDQTPVSDDVTELTATIDTQAEATDGADAAQADAAPAEAPIEPGVVTVENAISEDQMRQKIARMAAGRKNYELCGTLKASPSTISNFIKGKGAATSKMLEGLGVKEQVVYVVTDPVAFTNLSV